MQFRTYQSEAVSAGVNTNNGVLVLPTGAGKSVVIGGIAKECEGDTLVLQPSLEILKSNVLKAHHFGMFPSVFSASANRKEFGGHLTYATIGTIIKHLDYFRKVRTVMIDEAHLVNAKGGMYEQLITTLNPQRLLGLTATPYRQTSSSLGTCMKILTRTRPKLFDRIEYVVNPRELLQQGFLVSPTIYSSDADTSMLRTNSTGAEFTLESQAVFFKINGIKKKIYETVLHSPREHVLIFVESIADAKEIVETLRKAGQSAAEINAETPADIRRYRLEQFQEGSIRVMVNVRALTTGYDFPALNCIIDGAVTLSAALHYQKFGRGVRVVPGKTWDFHDLAGNVARMGNPLNWMLLPNLTGNYELYGEQGRVTTRILTDKPESKMIMPIGKYKGRRLEEINDQYIEWAAKELRGDLKHQLWAEVQRRAIVRHLQAA